MLVKSFLKAEGEVEMRLGIVDLINKLQGRRENRAFRELILRLYTPWFDSVSVQPSKFLR